MNISRKFLDWRKPALAQAVAYLCERYETDGRLDLSRVVIALPGGRAGRRLLELLVDAAAERNWSFVPGEMLTIGQLPELLYVAKRPLANELTQRAAWAQALQRVATAVRQQIIPFPPSNAESLAWLELGDLLRREHLELAGDGLKFQNVLEEIAKLDVPRDVQRWRSLVKVQDEYHAILDKLGLWDRQTARLEAVRRGECRIDRDVVLLGTVDLNQTLRQMLDAIAARTTVLIPAPADPESLDIFRVESSATPSSTAATTKRRKTTVKSAPQEGATLAERLDELFDGHGCLVPQRWQAVALPLADEQLHLVERPTDQAVRVADCLASYDGSFDVEQITIGVPDENPELVAHVERQLAERGVVARWGPGRTMADSLPYRLFEAIAEYLRTETRAPFAALVRHPDVCDWLTARVSAIKDEPVHWLARFDDYLATQYPDKVGPPWLSEEVEEGPTPHVFDQIQKLLAPFAGGVRPLNQWNEPLRGLLRQLYGERSFDLWRPTERATWRTCEAFEATWASFDSVPAPLMPEVPAADAIGLTLSALKRETIPSAIDEPAVELLGWLELPLDDAPALVVTSFNDGTVPQAVNSDPFLPNTMRGVLKLDDNERRYARDAYALALLQASRRRLDLIVGQRTSDGDPLAPSRLLLAGDDETILRRVRRLFRAESASPPPPPPQGRPANPARTLFVPTPAEILVREPALRRRRGAVEPLEELRVTQFRAYLACPYRFFLGHVVGLRSASDDVQELDPMAFGSLLHDVLRRFGESERRDSTDPRAIQAALSADLDRLAGGRYGSQPLPAVRVQLEQIRLRLAQFAECQAARAAAGWRVFHVEDEERTLRARFDVDGQPITLIGRIDRIDQHKTSGAFAVLDYKTSRKADKPEKAHYRGDRWVDLQLPLYRYLARAAEVEGPLELGYVLLPPDGAKAGFAFAQWSDEQLAEADETARRVVRQLRKLVYWPRSTDMRAEYDEFAGICQTDVMGATP